jgi:outer membrane protein OmpA-like peptidoglycan-associated protein
MPNKTKFIFIILAFFVFSSSHCWAQGYSTKSTKAIKLFEQATQFIQMREYKLAIGELEKAISDDPFFTEAYLLIAEVWDYSGNSAKVIEYCEKALTIGGDKYAITYYYLTVTYFKNGEYSKSLEKAKAFIDKKQFTSKQKSETDKIIVNCKFAIDAMKHPVPFKPVNLGKNINTSFDEYWPCLTADEEMLVFTRLLPKDYNNPKAYRNRQEDLFSSTFSNNEWQKAVSMGEPLNSPDNEGAQSISSDGKKMYFTACNRADGLGKCDIYVCEKTATGWSVPVNLGEPISTGYSEKQPSISSDGKTLYFVSNRPGGKGNYDLWYSEADNNDKWSKPVNMGDSINTPYDDQSPFIHPDNRTLYFASLGWPGMGEIDIYYSRKKNNNEWATPVNLGYPINTNTDEVGLIVNAKGDHAYFASNRVVEEGRDIYEFELYNNARPVLVSYFKGKVFDAETNKPLDAKFELIDLKSASIINQAVANKFSGEFLVCIPTDHDYALNVSKTGYLFYSDNFTISGINDKSKPFRKDIPLQAIKNGNKVVLKNIFFGTGSFDLKPESTAELNKLMQFMNLNASLKIEISGHTDNVGNDIINNKLSENRAKAVADYLISKGIPTNRLIYKGYGKTQPISDNQKEEGRALNRRTEFKIIGF